MAYSQKVVDKFEQTLKNPKEASVWEDGNLETKTFTELVQA